MRNGCTWFSLWQTRKAVYIWTWILGHHNISSLWGFCFMSWTPLLKGIKGKGFTPSRDWYHWRTMLSTNHILYRQAQNELSCRVLSVPLSPAWMDRALVIYLPFISQYPGLFQQWWIRSLAKYTAAACWVLLSLRTEQEGKASSISHRRGRLGKLQEVSEQLRKAPD